MDEVVSLLRSIIVNDLYVEMHPDEIGLDDGLRTVVGLDSLGFVELRVLCEQHYKVEISDDDYTPDNFDSIRHLADLILRLRSQETAAA